MNVLPIHDGLVSSRRVGVRARDAVAMWEVAALLGTGVVTALLNAYVKPSLGIPGSAIVWTVVPMALGVAMVPRKGAGTIMGSSALATTLLMHSAGTGAMASMFAAGVFLDLALRRAKGGVRLYAAFALAGFAGNACAFVSRALGKMTGIDSGSSALASWWSHALVSYALCGLLAGLISATLWFQLGRKNRAE